MIIDGMKLWRIWASANWSGKTKERHSNIAGLIGWCNSWPTVQLSQPHIVMTITIDQSAILAQMCVTIQYPSPIVLLSRSMHTILFGQIVHLAFLELHILCQFLVTKTALQTPNLIWSIPTLYKISLISAFCSKISQSKNITRLHGWLNTWVNTRPRKMEADFTLLKNRDENSQKAEIGKNTKN